MRKGIWYKTLPLAILALHSIFSLQGVLRRDPSVGLLIGASAAMVILFSFLFWESARGLDTTLGFRLAVFTLISTNLAVQTTGGSTSPLFPFYYLLIFFSGLRGGVGPSFLLFGAVLILEGGASLSQGNFGMTKLPQFVGLGLFSLFCGRLLGHQRSVRKGLESRLTKLESRQRSLTPGDIDRESIVGTLSREGETGDLRTVFALDDSLASLLDLMSEDFDPFTVGLFLSDREEGHLCLHYLRTKSKAVRRDAVVEAGRGILGWVAKEKKELLAGEFTNPYESLGYYEKDEFIRSVAAMPVLLGSELEGVLVVDWREERTFVLRERDRLRGFAHQVAALLNLSRWGEAMKGEAVRFSAFQELAKCLSQEIELKRVLDLIAEASERVLPFDRLVIALTEDGLFRVMKSVGRRVFLKEGLAFDPEGSLVGLVAATKRWTKTENLRNREVESPLFFKGENLPKWAASFLGAPLLVEEERPVGVLTLLSSRRAYSAEDAQHLAFLANLSSNAIEKARLYDKTRALAIRDGLTGLYNHRHFQEQLSEELKQTEAKGASLSLLLLDIDRFKKLNDKYGHPAGDEVLKGLARTLQRNSRERDIVARYGGEEFALILPATELESGLKIGEVLRESVEKACFIVDKDSLRITVSVGLATYPEQTKTKEDLIGLADTALYRAKQEGRNRVVHLGLKPELP